MRFRSAFRIALALMAVAGPATRATAQAAPDKPAAGELVTDRPDFTESSLTIAPGFLQFESGFALESSVAGGSKSRSLAVPSALLRVGLTQRVELRLGGDGFVSERTGGTRTSGYSDFEAGVKVRLLDEAHAGFDMSIIPMASLPTGSDSFSSGAVDPTLKLTFARSLPASLDVTGNVNFSSLTDDAGRFRQTAFSVSFGHDLVAGFGGFAEIYGFSPLERGGRTATTFDAGVTHPIGGDLQLDLSAGYGLTAAAPEWSFGFGFAIRRHR